MNVELSLGGLVVGPEDVLIVVDRSLVIRGEAKLATVPR